MDFINIIGTFFDNSIEHVIALAHLIKDLRLNKNQLEINEDLYDLLRITKETKDKCKGYYDNHHSLLLNIPEPNIGDWAIVKDTNSEKWYIYKCVVDGHWKKTDEEYSSPINLTEYAKREDLKTINGQSILGEGNIDINQNNADSHNSGLMSSESYVSLLTLKNETIPRIKEDIEHILYLLDNNAAENIQTILDRYDEIAEFITELGEDSNGLILYKILRDIDELKEFVTTKEEEYQELKTELTDVKDDNTRIHLIIDSINESISAINQDIIVIEENVALRLSLYNTRIEALNTRITQLDNNTLAAIQTVNETIDSNVNTINGSIGEINDSIDSINNSIDSINGLIIGANVSIEDFSSDVLGIKNSISNLEDGIEDINSDMEGLENDISSVRSQVSNINSQISNLISSLISGETTRATAAEEALSLRIATLETTPLDLILHVFLTLEEYDALESYAVDTIYFIIERTESNTHFGDKFPLIFG